MSDILKGSYCKQSLMKCMPKIQNHHRISWTNRLLEWVNSQSSNDDNWRTGTFLSRIIAAQWEGIGDVGSAKYEMALLPPCPTTTVLSFSNCQRSTHSISRWRFRNLAPKVKPARIVTNTMNLRVHMEIALSLTDGKVSATSQNLPWLIVSYDKWIVKVHPSSSWTYMAD